MIVCDVFERLFAEMDCGGVVSRGYRFEYGVYDSEQYCESAIV